MFFPASSLNSLLRLLPTPGLAVGGIGVMARPRCVVCNHRVRLRDEVRLRGAPVHLECSYYTMGVASRPPGAAQLGRALTNSHREQDHGLLPAHYRRRQDV
jgi:hypothetical protein